MLCCGRKWEISRGQRKPTEGNEEEKEAVEILYLGILRIMRREGSHFELPGTWLYR